MFEGLCSDDILCSSKLSFRPNKTQNCHKIIQNVLKIGTFSTKLVCFQDTGLRVLGQIFKTLLILSLCTLSHTARIFSTDDGLEVLLSLENIYVVGIQDPTPGVWHLQAGSSGSHTIRVTAISQLDFSYGFSKEMTWDFTSTMRRPIKGKICSTCTCTHNPYTGYVLLEFIVMDRPTEWYIQVSATTRKRPIGESEAFFT